jgi:hypothetical protein
MFYVYYYSETFQEVQLDTITKFKKHAENLVNKYNKLAIRNCYFSEKDILVLESVLGYKIYKKN